MGMDTYDNLNVTFLFLFDLPCDSDLTKCTRTLGTKIHKYTKKKESGGAELFTIIRRA